MIRRGLVLEVLSLYIPDLVEAADLENMARVLKAVDRGIPLTVPAFFPEDKMKDFASPSVTQMVDAYQRVKAVRLTNVRLGNVACSPAPPRIKAYLMENVNPDAY